MSGEPFSVRSGVRTSNFSHESRADIAGAKPHDVKRAAELLMEAVSPNAGSESSAE